MSAGARTDIPGARVAKVRRTDARIDPLLHVAQRGTAVVLAVTVLVHLGTIVYAVRGGLTAGEILGRTQGNPAFLAFYAVFVLAAAVHAPIGLRSVLREWTGWRGRSLNLAMLALSALLAGLGLRAALAVYLA